MKLKAQIIAFECLTEDTEMLYLVIFVPRTIKALTFVTVLFVYTEGLISFSFLFRSFHLVRKQNKIRTIYPSALDKNALTYADASAACF